VTETASITAEDLRRGLRRPVGVGIRRRTAAGPPPLHPLEEGLLGPRAVEQRRVLFALGRAAARDALAEFGVHDVGIGRGSAGEPLWPPGFVGAISHSSHLAIALVGRRTNYVGLGVDVEDLARRLTVDAARLVCRPAEMAWLDVQAVDVASQRLMLLFSAKETVFKATYPIEGVWLGFADAELTWRAERPGFDARLMKSAGAQYPVGFLLEVRCSVIGDQILSVTGCLA
jgi:4'-phosphopantetheinyl transferase EntD